MIIVLTPEVTEKEIEHIIEKIKKVGLAPHIMRVWKNDNNGNRR